MKTSFTHYDMESAPQSSKRLLNDINKQYGFIPNLFAYMAEAPTTIEAYLMLTDLVSKTSLTPAQQQVALLAASVENKCEFCTVAHHASGIMNQVNEQTLQAIINQTEIHDRKDSVLTKLTQSVVKTRGNPNQAIMEEFFEAGFSRQQVLEVVLVVTIKTLSNYINHLTQPEPNKELLAMI